MPRPAAGARRAAAALDIDVPLLSDWNGDAVRAFGVGHDYRGMRDVAERTAFLIDAEGTIRDTWRYASEEVPDFDVLVAAADPLRATRNA